MNGMKYHMYFDHLSVQEVAERSGICRDRVLRFCHNIPEGTSMKVLYRLACAMDVTVDELVREYPDSAMAPGDHPAVQAKRTDKAMNALGVYRRRKNLTYDEFTALLGLRSRQATYVKCTAPVPDSRCVELLAKREKMSAEAFLALYREEGTAC